MCGEEKPLTLEFFHSDKSKPSGFACACKTCKNSSRTPKKTYLNTAKRVDNMLAKAYDFCEGEVSITPVYKGISVPISEEEPSISILTTLSQKFGCHYSLSIQRDGKSRLQIHRPDFKTETYKAMSPEELLAKVL